MIESNKGAGLVSTSDQISSSSLKVMLNPCSDDVRRTPCGTTCRCTSASCAWRTSRAPSGPSTRSSTTADGRRGARRQPRPRRPPSQGKGALASFGGPTVQSCVPSQPQDRNGVAFRVFCQQLSTSLFLTRAVFESVDEGLVNQGYFCAFSRLNLLWKWRKPPHLFTKSSATDSNSVSHSQSGDIPGFFPPSDLCMPQIQTNFRLLPYLSILRLLLRNRN